MQQIANWLEELGMSEYAQRFADNDIDLTILRDLTDQDLKELGVASLGHRRKLLRAIAALEDAPCSDTLGTCGFVSNVGAELGRRSAVSNLSARRGHRRTSLSHGDVLRSGGLDQHFRAA
jgi:hypothetical protein